MQVHGQALALANIKLGMLREQEEVGELTPRIQEIVDIIGEARAQSKELTWQLSPPVLYELGLVAALRWLANDVQRRYGLRVTVEDKGECAGLDETTRISLFRSVNELLINVAKHAGTSEAYVRLSSQGQLLMMRVEDQGAGFENGSDSVGFGLLSIRERLNHLGGIIQVDSLRGKGTKAVMIAPMRRPDLTTCEAAA